jgi:HD-GYP domain-containing protein (c-di-GMP phosphodiesterase class II)
LTSDRPYRRQLSDREAIEILLARRGKMYDPLVVDTFLRVHSHLAPPSGATEAHAGTASPLSDVGLSISPEPSPN